MPINPNSERLGRVVFEVVIGCHIHERRAVKGKFNAPLCPSFFSSAIITRIAVAPRTLSTGVTFEVALSISLLASYACR